MSTNGEVKLKSGKKYFLELINEASKFVHMLKLILLSPRRKHTSDETTH